MAVEPERGAPLTDPLLLDERAEDLYEDAPCGYLSALPDGTVVKVNRTFERWTGHDRAGIVGAKRFQDLLAPGARIYHETHYLPLLQMQGSVREIAVELIRADGHRMPVLLNSVLHRDAEGAPRIVRTTIFDATDRRRYERELLNARRRAEALQRRASLLSEASRALDATPGVSGRATRIAELLAELPGVSAAVMAGEPLTLLAEAGPATGDPALLSALESAVAREERTGTGDVAAVPLSVGGRLLGALCVARADPDELFTDPEGALLADLGDRLALALETARLYDHQYDVAHALQRSMLAGELPDDPRCTLGNYYAPAVTTLEVGGDWYDAFCLGPERIGLVIGDVVGRGLHAAATMGQLRSAVRALAGARLGPAGVLEHLDSFVELTEVARSATVGYAELDLETGRLQLACAGHPPPILLAPDAEPELLWGGRSTPLGALVRSAARGQAEIALPAGARLLLYTDGFVERRGKAIDAGMDELMAVFARHRDTALDEIGPRIATELLGDVSGDDVCLLVLEFGSPHDFHHSLPSDAAALAGLRGALGGWLGREQVPAADADALVLACSEVAGNAIEHAYRSLPGTVHVLGDRAGDAIVLEVRDRGTWRAPREPGGRGRGLQIVEQLMNEVTIDRGNGTSVIMRLTLGGENG